MTRYLIADYGNDKGNTIPKLSIVNEEELFKILQEKKDGITVYRLPEYSIINWS